MDALSSDFDEKLMFGYEEDSAEREISTDNKSAGDQTNSMESTRTSSVSEDSIDSDPINRLKLRNQHFIPPHEINDMTSRGCFSLGVGRYFRQKPKDM